MSKDEVVNVLKSRGLDAGIKDKVPFLFSGGEAEKQTFLEVLSEIGYQSSYGYHLEDADEGEGGLSVREKGILVGEPA